MTDDQKDNRGELSASSKTIKVWQSAELFGEAKLVQIEHDGEVYQLRITQLGKLVLNK